jgi:hypothetical protein
MKSWTFFVGSCILTTGILLKIGVPLVPLAIGIAAAGLFNWKRQRRA